MLQQTTVDDSSISNVSKLYYEVAFSTLLYGYLLITLIIRRCKLAHAASHRIDKYPRSFCFRIIMTSLLIIFYVVFIILSFTIPPWVNSGSNKYFSFLYLIPIIALAYLIRMLFYDYKHRLPLVWYVYKLFWIFSSVAFISLIVYIKIVTNIPSNEMPWGEFFIDIMKAVISIIMAIFHIIHPQDWDKFEEFQDLNTMLLSNSSTSLRIPVSFKKKTQAMVIRSKTTPIVRKPVEIENETIDLTVVIKSKIQQKYNSSRNKNEFLYNLQVRIGKQNYKITKSLSDFQTFEKLILFENTPQDQNPSQSAKRSNVFGGSFIGLGDLKEFDITQTISSLQNFMNHIIQNSDYTARIQLMSFLDVKEPEKTHFINMSQNLVYQPEKREQTDTSGMTKTSRKAWDEKGETSSEGDYIEEESKEAEQKSAEKTNAEDFEFCPFFEVKITKHRRPPHDDYIEYFIQLRMVEKPDEKWEIIKRYTDFRALHKAIRKQCAIRPPQLPSKLLLHDETQLRKRRIGLEGYLKAVLNEKIYFKVPEVFEFININPGDFSWLQEEESVSFSNYKAKVLTTEVAIMKNKPTTYYEIIITELSAFNNVMHSKTLRKTFKEFETLHKTLERRFKTSCSGESLKLPDLPSKYNAYSNKTSAKYRSQGVEKYLNELFKISVIGDSFAFRKFIGYLSDSRPGSQLEIMSPSPSMPQLQLRPIQIQRSSSPLTESGSGRGKEIESSPNSFSNMLLKKKYKD